MKHCALFQARFLFRLFPFEQIFALHFHFLQVHLQSLTAYLYTFFITDIIIFSFENNIHLDKETTKKDRHKACPKILINGNDNRRSRRFHLR